MSGDKQKPTCFIIMPFGEAGSKEEKRSLDVYRIMLKPAVESLGYVTTRADDFHHTGSITRDIIESLYNADIVIADLTGGNPNVFYELGVRHTLKKSGTIPIIEKGHNLPFDISDYRAIFYSTDIAGAKDFEKDLQRKIVAVREAAREDRHDNPVHSVLGEKLHFRPLTEDEEEMRTKLQIINMMSELLR